jgi:hypothetical protein
MAVPFLPYEFQVTPVNTGSGIRRTSDGGRAECPATLAGDRPRYQPKETAMNPIRHLRRLAAALAGLACAWLGLAIAAPAAFANVTVPGPGMAGPAPITTPPVGYPCSPECSPLLDKHLLLSHGHSTGTVYRVHTVVVGGMPGWQIALIAVVAALLATTAAVLAYRAWAARRKPVTAAA